MEDDSEEGALRETLNSGEHSRKIGRFFLGFSPNSPNNPNNPTLLHPTHTTYRGNVPHPTQPTSRTRA